MNNSRGFAGTAVRRSRPGALVLFALLASVGCGERDTGLSDRERNEKMMTDAVGTLNRNGTAKHEKHPVAGEHWKVDLHGRQIDSDVVDALVAVQRVSELNLSRSSITDGQLATLRDRRATQVFHKIDLSHTAVTDATVEWLADCPLLAELDVTGTKVTPAAVERLRQKRKDNAGINKMFKSPSVKM